MSIGYGTAAAPVLRAAAPAAAPQPLARRLVPARLLPQVARLRMDALWQDATFRAQAEQEMRFLLEHTDRADEARSRARGYAEQMVLRSLARWHPGPITRQPVQGAEWLTTERDPSRGVVLSFMHHHRYDGLFGSLARHGVRSSILAAPEIMDAPVGSSLHQHAQVVSKGGPLVRSSDGIPAFAERLERGEILAVASDFPGRTEITFLGRRVLGSFGAARLAVMTNSPVVLITIGRETGRPTVRVHEPLEPSDYAGPGELLADIVRRHEPAILAWPEALDGPTTRFGHISPFS